MLASEMTQEGGRGGVKVLHSPELEPWDLCEGGKQEWVLQIALTWLPYICMTHASPHVMHTQTTHK